MIIEHNLTRKLSILLACFGFTLLPAQTSIVTIQTVSNYNQWKWDTTIVMQNGLITMATVPAIGGRVMQYDLGTIPSMMVNSREFGNKYTPANGGYHNFGGFKNWPSPQDVWPGTWPPPPTLDYGAYSVLDISQTNDSISLSTVSPVEKWVAPNIQLKRRATMFHGSSRIRMEQTILNKGTKDTSWGMWSIVQSIVNHTGKTDTANYWAYFPINPHSAFGSSGVKPYEVSGSKAWKGAVAPGVYGVQFVADNKKIFADPDKGWIAYTSLSDTVVFARTFPVFEGMKYPDGGARTTVYVSGSSPTDPLYMEVEVKSPVVLLAAGVGNYTFIENWWAAKVRGPILDVDSVGAIAKRISYNATTKGLTAIYGVFYEGTATAAFIDAQGHLLVEGSPHPVSPLTEFKLQETIGLPDSAKSVEIRIYNTKNQLVGNIESITISGLFTDVKEHESVQPIKYRLEQNYPNPFNPTTVISFQVPAVSLVTLRVYDVLGREAAVLVNEKKPAGSYQVQWNAGGIPSGIYFYQLQAGSFLQTKKMLLLK